MRFGLFLVGQNEIRGGLFCGKWPSDNSGQKKMAPARHVKNVLLSFRVLGILCSRGACNTQIYIKYVDSKLLVNIFFASVGGGLFLW